jgi:hypothetical protein
MLKSSTVKTLLTPAYRSGVDVNAPQFCLIAVCDIPQDSAGPTSKIEYVFKSVDRTIEVGQNFLDTFP